MSAAEQHNYYLELRARRRQWRDFLFYKWDGKCAFCQREPGYYRITVDHICPKSRGGSDETYNLRPLCKDCHGDLNRYNQCVGALMLARMIGAAT